MEEGSDWCPEATIRPLRLLVFVYKPARDGPHLISSLPEQKTPRPDHINVLTITPDNWPLSSNWSSYGMTEMPRSYQSYRGQEKTG